jgi:hypothetical protein
MVKEMRPCWTDAGAPKQLQKLPPAYERPLKAKEEEALEKRVAGEIKERIVVRMRKAQVRFLNPTVPAPKSKGRGKKVVDCSATDRRTTGDSLQDGRGGSWVGVGDGRGVRAVPGILAPRRVLCLGRKALGGEYYA